MQSNKKSTQQFINAGNYFIIVDGKFISKEEDLLKLDANIKEYDIILAFQNVIILEHKLVKEDDIIKHKLEDLYAQSALLRKQVLDLTANKYSLLHQGFLEEHQMSLEEKIVNFLEEEKKKLEKEVEELEKEEQVCYGSINGFC